MALRRRVGCTSYYLLFPGTLLGQTHQEWNRKYLLIGVRERGFNFPSIDIRSFADDDVLELPGVLQIKTFLG